MAYIARIKAGTTFFKEGIKVSWKNATQEQLETVYELGYTNFVSKSKKDDKKAPKGSAKKQTKLQDKQDEQQD